MRSSPASLASSGRSMATVSSAPASNGRTTGAGTRWLDAIALDDPAAAVGNVRAGSCGAAWTRGGALKTNANRPSSTTVIATLAAMPTPLRRCGSASHCSQRGGMLMRRRTPLQARRVRMLRASSSMGVSCSVLFGSCKPSGNLTSRTRLPTCGGSATSATTGGGGSSRTRDDREMTGSDFSGMTSADAAGCFGLAAAVVFDPDRFGAGSDNSVALGRCGITKRGMTPATIIVQRQSTGRYDATGQDPHAKALSAKQQARRSSYTFAPLRLCVRIA